MYQDPNQPRAPAPYPRALYASRDNYIIVENETGEADARARGFSDFGAVDIARDHLEQREQGWLLNRAAHLVREDLGRKSQAELVNVVRALEAAERDRLEKPTELHDEFSALDEDGLRAFLTDRDGKRPHHRAGREKLLSMARAEPIAA